MRSLYSADLRDEVNRASKSAYRSADLRMVVVDDGAQYYMVCGRCSLGYDEVSTTAELHGYGPVSVYIGRIGAPELPSVVETLVATVATEVPGLGTCQMPGSLESGARLGAQQRYSVVQADWPTLVAAVRMTLPHELWQRVASVDKLIGSGPFYRDLTGAIGHLIHGVPRPGHDHDLARLFFLLFPDDRARITRLRIVGARAEFHVERKSLREEAGLSVEADFETTNGRRPMTLGVSGPVSVAELEEAMVSVVAVLKTDDNEVLDDIDSRTFTDRDRDPRIEIVEGAASAGSPIEDDARVVVASPMNWVIGATPGQVAPRLRDSAERVGLKATVGPRLEEDGTYWVQILWPAEDASVELAAGELLGLPGSLTELVLRPSSVGVSGALESASSLQARWHEFGTVLRNRLAFFLIPAEDALAPGFSMTQVRHVENPLSIRRPSERSMWVAPVFPARDFHQRDDFCFVLMPFDDSFRGFYDHAIKPVVEEKSFVCERADEVLGGQSDIMEDIWIALNEARFIVADLTDGNPNVFYELGIANTLGKRVIATHRKQEAGAPRLLPFDVRLRRTIFYTDNAEGIAKFQQALGREIDAIRTSRA